MEAIENYHQAKARLKAAKFSQNIRALLGVALIIANACYFYLLNHHVELSTHALAVGISIGLAFFVTCNHVSLNLFKQATKLHCKTEDEVAEKVMDLAEIAFHESKDKTHSSYLIPPSFLSKEEASLWLRRYKQMINIEAEKNRERS